MGVYRGDEAKLLTEMYNGKCTRGKSYKLQQEKPQIDMRKKFSILQQSGSGIRVQRSVQSSSLEILKTQLEKAMNNLLEVGPAVSGELDQMTSRSLFQTKSTILVILYCLLFQPTIFFSKHSQLTKGQAGKKQNPLHILNFPKTSTLPSTPWQMSHKNPN